MPVAIPRPKQVAQRENQHGKQISPKKENTTQQSESPVTKLYQQHHFSEK